MKKILISGIVVAVLATALFVSYRTLVPDRKVVTENSQQKKSEPAQKAEPKAPQVFKFEIGFSNATFAP